MKRTALYQAISNKEETIPKKPIRCSSEDARLGQGYYFWDTDIQAAHWWGKSRYKGAYRVCRSHYDAHSEHYFDLVGNMKHIQILSSCHRKLQQRKKGDYSIAEVLELMKRLIPEFIDIYWAIRARPMTKRYLDPKMDIPFAKGGNNRLFISCATRVQVCVTNLDFLLDGREYKVIESETSGDMESETSGDFLLDGREYQVIYESGTSGDMV